MDARGLETFLSFVALLIGGLVFYIVLQPMFAQLFNMFVQPIAQAFTLLATVLH